MFELGESGAVTCGSVMVPPSWFPEVTDHPQLDRLDLGIHLTLTSESAAFRWRPLSTTSYRSGLIDPDGYLWPTVPELRRHANPDAVEAELRAQLECALAEGIDVTHLDHHMGAALAPEFVGGTIRLATEYHIPLLFPSDVQGYLDLLNMGPVDASELASHRASAGALAVGDTFIMPLAFHNEPETRPVFERLLSTLTPGVTFLSLHCSTPGEIETIHPNDAHWRIAEHRLFSDPGFVRWIADQGITLAGMRQFKPAKH